MPREQGGYDTEAVADIHDRFHRKVDAGKPRDVAKDEAVDESAAAGHEVPPENAG